MSRVSGLPQLGRGQQIELHITGTDELALELDIRYVSTIDAVVEASDVADEPEAPAATNDSVLETELAESATPALADTVAMLPADGSNTSIQTPPSSG